MSETVRNQSLEVKAEPFADTTRGLLTKSGAQTVKQSFDRTGHQPFRLDNKGLNKEVTIKEFSKGGQGDGEVRIPGWWQKNAKTNANRTFTDMQANRRKEFVPDISFDLDGDGVVGNRDLVIAKLFDKDGDGKLNAQERANADAAIRDVSESPFVSSA